MRGVMKRMSWRQLIGGIAVAVLTTTAAQAAPHARHNNQENSRTSAPHAILIDGDSGSVLFERDADRLVYPASLAKLMTVEYVFNEIKQGRVKLDRRVHHQRERVAARRRAVAHLVNVCQDPQHVSGR